MEEEIVLIFGGDGKIAKAIVNKYLNNKCKVIAIDRKEKSDNVEFYDNENYSYYSADVTDVQQLSNLCLEIEKKYQHINHIISAAGAPFPSELDDLLNTSIDDIDKSIKLNLNAHIYIAKIFLPLLYKARDNKSVVLVSSVNALKSFDLPAYSAAKSGIYGFMNSIVREIGKDGIRINTITPGTVATQQEIDDRYCNYKYKDMMALRKFTAPEDIADATFSLTHIARAITGQNLVVDCGQIV